jgi:hypothetical protein
MAFPGVGPNVKPLAGIAAPLPIPSLPFPPATLQDCFDSKNNKSRVVCTEELALLIDQHGPPIYLATSACSAVQCSAVRAPHTLANPAAD